MSSQRLRRSTSDADIDRASVVFATIVTIVTVTVAIGWLCRRASFSVRTPTVVAEGGAALVAWQAAAAMARKAGMTSEHFAQMQQIESAGITTWYRHNAAALELTAAENAAWYGSIRRRPIVMPPEILTILKSMPTFLVEPHEEETSERTIYASASLRPHRPQFVRLQEKMRLPS